MIVRTSHICVMGGRTRARKRARAHPNVAVCALSLNHKFITICYFKYAKNDKMLK